MELGIALHRISSIGQSEGHSLEAQESNTARRAESMGVPIIRGWSSITSSKKGKNLSRKDLQEIKIFCRQNRRVKYLFVDRANRLMREVKLMIHYIVELEIIGVKVIFCDPTQDYLNGNDQLSQLMLFIEGFKSEAENKERAETTIARMKARYAAGYYLSHPHPGYTKSDIAGRHIPDPERFSLLQSAGKLIIYEQNTPAQAVRWLKDNGYRSKGGEDIDLNDFSKFIVNRYYCGYIDINSEGWPKNVRGVHEAMFSKREHSVLVDLISKRNPSIRRKHNEEFPVANLLRHFECMDVGHYEKFSGHLFNPGKRPNGKQRDKQPVYDCRDCRKRINRERVHQALSWHLDRLELKPSLDVYRSALVRTWKLQRGSVSQRLALLGKNKAELENKVKETAQSYAIETDSITKEALRAVIVDYDQKAKELEVEIARTQTIDLESEGFVKFAIGFTENLRKNWWKLSFENKKRGEQILFNGKIYLDNSGKVHTPNLSSIYRLGTNKKALEKVSNAHLVELAGTTPASEW